MEGTYEITFSDEDMEVGYLDHRRPLYLASSINQIPIKRALVDTRALVCLISLSTLQSARILENKILGYSMEVTGFGGKGKYTVGNIQLWLKAETHLMETMFYDEWALSRESFVSKPSGTFVPRWEDIENESEPDLRELLA